jgi:hypothetical protein
MGKILLVIGIVIVLFIADMLFTTNEPAGRGTVLEKVYSPEETSTGVGYGTTTSGKPGVVVMTSHKEDEYFVFVNTKDGSIKTKATMQKYLQLKKDQEIKLNYHCGWLTGIKYSTWVE